MALTLKSRFVGNVYVIQCAGAIQLGPDAKELEALLEKRTPEFARIVLEMSELHRLDSMGMGLLVRWADRLGRRGGGVRLAAAPAFVTRLLEMTKLDGLLPQHATEEEAIVSFLEQGRAEAAAGKRGPRVLMFDPSADLCIFVRTVLERYGFDVRSTCSFADAKVLLRVDRVDTILLGPAGDSALRPEEYVGALLGMSPGAGVLQLVPGFKTQDAEEATEELLKMFGVARE